MESKKNKKVKLHIKTGDTVKVIAGDEKGKEGKILSIDFTKQRAVVEDLNMVYKHVKPTASNPNGNIVEQESSIHISNLMVVNPATKKAARIGRKRDENGKLQRYFKEHTSHKEEK